MKSRLFWCKSVDFFADFPFKTIFFPNIHHESKAFFLIMFVSWTSNVFIPIKEVSERFRSRFHKISISTLNLELWKWNSPFLYFRLTFSLKTFLKFVLTRLPEGGGGGVVLVRRGLAGRDLWRWDVCGRGDAVRGPWCREDRGGGGGWTGALNVCLQQRSSTVHKNKQTDRFKQTKP